MKNQIAVFSMFALVATTTACGKNDKKTSSAGSGGTVSALSVENQGEFAAQASDEAISAATAGDSEGATGFSLQLAGDAGAIKSSTRQCVEQSDGTAVVTIASELALENSVSNERISRELKMSGKSEEKRIWSHPSGVKCLNDERAKVNLLTDPTNYSLKVSIERSREQSRTETNLRKKTTLTSSRSFSMSGERQVSIVSFSKDSAADESTLVKNVSGKMARSFSFINKTGETKSGSFSSETVEGKPMVVKVKRKISSNEVVSRELVSGTRLSTVKDGGKVETSFSNLLMKGAGEQCQAESGSFSIKYLDSEGAVSKSVSCSASAGELSCTDASGAAVEIESPSCDPADEK
ncbi:MAG: hypothetical protein RIR26_1362 [Pseudomonadota bacterium]|jgi:hypothetical protein